MEIDNFKQFEAIEYKPSDLLRTHESEHHLPLSGIKTLFEAARYPSTSPHGCAHNLLINVKRNVAGDAINQASIRTIKPSYSQYGVGFREANEFDIRWWERNHGEEPWHRTYTDTVTSNCLTDSRGTHVFDLLMNALYDSTLNPKHGPNVQAYIANLQLGRLPQSL